MAVHFELLAVDSATGARRGRLHTPHGVIETPAFMPVGTQATVKGLTPDVLRAAGTQCLLANTYHLHVRPGEDVVAQMGGLHRFMNWDGAILTDSGGFQVFSLADINQIDEEGVSFKSHVDGSMLRLDPRRAMAIQNKLGADIIMAFDHCPSSTADERTIRQAVARSLRWAAQCKGAHARPGDQALFGIVQGGLDVGLRRSCLEELVALDLPGYAMGGLAVGETHAQMVEVLNAVVPHMPAHKPRYLMGVGQPRDLAAAVASGIDMFDCVLPTRNGRNAQAYTRNGPVRLRNERYKLDPTPLDPESSFPPSRQYAKAYLRHLFQVGEMLGPMLVSAHNVCYYHGFLAQARRAIETGAFGAWLAQALQGGETGPTGSA